MKRLEDVQAVFERLKATDSKWRLGCLENINLFTEEDLEEVRKELRVFIIP